MLFGSSILIDALIFLGVLHLLSIIGSTVLFWIQMSRAVLAQYFQPNEKHTLAAKYGKWAIVTGCTDGIGKQYAFQLAAREINVVLIARNIEKLTNTAKEIETKHAVKTKIIVADFSKGKEVYQHIQKELEGIPVGILVNNVGVNINFPKPVGDMNESEVWDLINVNVGAVTMMSKMVLPQMMNKRRGAIVNVSSGSEVQPLPLMSVYAATKTYNQQFSTALRSEYSKYNITIQHLSPFFINTKMNDFSGRLRQTSLFVPDAYMWARYAIETLGKVDHSTGYWTHGLQYFLIGFAPVWIRILIGQQLNKSFREEYLISQKSS